MKAIADATYGLIGRSPDHVAGLVTGLAMNPALLDALTPGFGKNLDALLRACAQERSLSLVRGDAALRHPQRAELFAARQRDDPTLKVIAEDDSGVTISA